MLCVNNTQIVLIVGLQASVTNMAEQKLNIIIIIKSFFSNS